MFTVCCCVCVCECVQPTRSKMKIVDPAADSHDLICDIPADVLPKAFGGQAELAAPLGKSGSRIGGSR